MIEIKGLTKKYDDHIILSDINMSIPDGCIFGIIGQSGVGKSTLLRCINGLEKFDSGSITVNNVELGSFSPKEILRFRRGIGMIFQNFALLERKTVIQNVELPMECWKYDKVKMKSRATELLERVGLKDKLHSVPSELSGGEKQRVAIARALVLEPTILLCDEATSSLDPAITQSILELLVEINAQLSITIVIVTHEMAVIKTACDRMGILEDGALVSNGLVGDVFLDDNLALQKLLGEKSITAPSGKELIKVVFRGKEADQQATYALAQGCNIPFGIFSANISPFHSGDYMGHIYLVADEGKGNALADALCKKGVSAKAGREFKHVF